MSVLNIVLGGQAGQGINTTEELLVKTFKKSGFNIFATKEYMSRVRGGINTTTIRISSDSVKSYEERVDILIPFAKGVVEWTMERLSDQAVVLGEENILDEVPEGLKAVSLEIEKMAKDLGNKLFANTILSGLICGILKTDKTVLENVVKNKFKNKGEDISTQNASAALKGYELGEDVCKEHGFSFDVERDKTISNDIVLNGSEAVALGALNGGCNFVSFYPMSPSSNVAVEMANMAEEMEIIVEQFEDEIAALNASSGAWYGGARGLVTTSGGGFALMCEGISLAGMAEIPLVIHLAQRPGPATGLPTRTAQSDLNLALYAGHGDFPRAIYAPSDIEEAYSLTSWAFDIADKYQVPAIVLTDEYLVDSYYNIKDLNVSYSQKTYIAEMEKDFKRYVFTENGVSPRGVPGYGTGVVIANGNEHDEYGDTTENAEISVSMLEKRMKKHDSMKSDTLEPFFYGDKNYSTLIISWGSTFNTVKSAIDRSGLKGVALLHFSQILPVYDISSYLEKAGNIIAVEQNGTGQFADLLQKEFCVKVDNRILKYDGRQMSEEFVVSKLMSFLGGK